MEGHFLFDEKLIADTIAYYKALDGRDLTPQEAERYLASLADWWDWLVASLHDPLPSRSGRGERAKHAAPEPSSDLISPDNC
jgi:hypothetical protein